MSPLSARKAEKLGYKKIRVFHAGLPAWKKAGNITVSNMAAIANYDKQDLSYILLDLRPAKEIEKGHMPKATAVPAGGLDKMKDQFPKYMAAPIILCNQDGNLKSAQDAFKKISAWGYKQISVLSGGFQAWEKAGKQIAKGPAATKIAYVRKLAPGEFDIAAFKELIAKPSKDMTILDVRTAKEIEEGVLPGAVSIPMDELQKRLAEVPKDKPIVIHCSTGVRAEMAYNELKKAGIDAKYVRANIDFDKQDKTKYTIEQ
jgi:rhodanese-related sulfurtransferase